MYVLVHINAKTDKEERYLYTSWWYKSLRMNKVCMHLKKIHVCLLTFYMTIENKCKFKHFLRHDLKKKM